MNLKKESDVNYQKPVAYDANNRPLYAHPPKSNKATQKTNTVHFARPVEPEKQEISDAIKSKHNKSKSMYPNLNLSEGEFVIRAVKRSFIGLVMPMLVGFLLIILALTFLLNIDSLSNNLFFSAGNVAINQANIILPTFIFIGLVLIGMYVIYYVYNNNEFFLTNESVIQEIQNSLFSKLEQTVSLQNIEDASFTQNGVVEHLFNYGSIRLSTEGEETTYRFSYVSKPKEVIAVLNNAVEAFKNGRPVVGD